MTERPQLLRLSRPFPPKYVRAAPAGKYGSYVAHDVIQQALLAILGPVDISIGEVFYSIDNRHIEGCLVTLTATIDGERVSVTEVGDCEQPGNWKTQGARMKDAISDGIKRCAMRLGCGLHLWSQSDYFLYDRLVKDAEEALNGAAPPKAPSMKNRRQNLSARIVALGAAGSSVAEKREAWNLPLVEDCDEHQLGLFEEMVSEIERDLETPM